jgi:hypothetical protein
VDVRPRRLAASPTFGALVAASLFRLSNGPNAAAASGYRRSCPDVPPLDPFITGGRTEPGFVTTWSSFYTSHYDVYDREV